MIFRRYRFLGRCSRFINTSYFYFLILYYIFFCKLHYFLCTQGLFFQLLLYGCSLHISLKRNGVFYADIIFNNNSSVYSTHSHDTLSIFLPMLASKRIYTINSFRCYIIYRWQMTFTKFFLCLMRYGSSYK